MFQTLDNDNAFANFDDFEQWLDDDQCGVHATPPDVMGACYRLLVAPKQSYLEKKLLEAYEVSKVQPFIEYAHTVVMVDSPPQPPVVFELGNLVQELVIVMTPIARPERQKKLPYFRKKQTPDGSSTLIKEEGIMVSRNKTRKEILLELNKGCIEINPGPNGKGPRVRRRPRRPYRPRTGNRGGQTGTHMVPLKINSPIRFMRSMPQSYFMTCIYTIPMYQIVGGGTTNSIRFRSEAYDVDPALATTAMANFAELAAMYSRYRCHALKYVFNVTNQEAFPVQLIHGFSTAVFGATALGANYAENRFFHTCILSPINGAKSTLTLVQKVKSTTLFGSIQPLTDDLFSGSTTSATLSASATMNCYIGGISAAVPVNGFFVGGTVELDLEFYRRNDIIG